METNKTKKRIIQAGQKAVEELIKVAKEKIVDSEDDVSADRLKNAAATKKLAIFDAFEILSRIEVISQTGASVRFVDIEPDNYNIDVNQIESVINKNTKASSFGGFAEGRSR